VVRQVPEMGAVVSHGICRAWDVIICGDVVVMVAM